MPRLYFSVFSGRGNRQQAPCYTVACFPGITFNGWPMKRVPFHLIALPLLVCWGAFPTIGSGSETRVDSAGGLTTVMTDETDDLSLFMDGNPAGLVLLQTRDRFDLAGQWDYSTSQPVTQASNQQTFSTIPRLSDPDEIRYAGLMVFPQDGWAYQVAGDYDNPEGQPVYSYDTYSSSQFRQLARVAYAAGPFALGLEVMNVVLDKTYDPGLYNPYVGVASGSSGMDQTLLRAGFITTFPGTRTTRDPVWRIGGVFAMEAAPSASTFNASLYYAGIPSFGLQQVTTTTEDYYFGPEVYYEVPNQAIVRFSSFVTDIDTDFAQDVSQVTPYFQKITSLHSTQYGSIDTTGAFKLMFPVSEKEHLNLGGSLSSISTDLDYVGTALNVYDDQQKQQIDTALGAGLESFRDYILGIQFKSQSYLYNTTAVSSAVVSTQTGTDYDFLQFSFGGEKWVTPSIAFRMGLVAEEDIYTGSADTRTLYTYILTGFGVQTRGFVLDLKLSFGQSVSLEDSNDTSSLTAAEVSGTLFL
jgi:hypothetical protein